MAVKLSSLRKTGCHHKKLSSYRIKILYAAGLNTALPKFVVQVWSAACKTVIKRSSPRGTNGSARILRSFVRMYDLAHNFEKTSLIADNERSGIQEAAPDVCS